MLPLNAIEFSHVTKIYKKGFLAVKVPAVTDLSFSVKQGSITGFVGPNGAGKTTAIKMLLGLVQPTKGTIQLSGVNVLDPKSRCNCAFISEQPYFYQHLTVRETLLFAARLYGQSSSGLTKEIEQTLESVELVNCENKKIKELSKGMQQRLAMAQALLLRSTTLIFDEPMSGMDPPGRALFRKILLSLSAQGKTIFFSTHILDDIEQICSDVVVVAKGRLEYQGSIVEILQKGFQGFELVVTGLSIRLTSELLKRGLTVTNLGNSGARIFASAKSELESCQRFLYENNILCESLTRQSLPLEDILYKK